MGRRRKSGRNIDGMILLNKSINKTSNFELQQVRRLFNANKAGHTGSLDPLATGMLPICFGESTKFSQFLLDADKGYRVTGKLGEKTETSDADGEIIQTLPVSVTKKQLLKVMENFRGDIKQIPSMYSAIKHNGQPLYKLARQGLTVERAPRDITIYDLKLISFDSPWFVLDVECSKGTYIRNLVEDIGDQLNCGAHVTALDRTWVGPFDPENMISFEELSAIKEEQGFTGLDEQLLPVDTPVADWPELHLRDDLAHYFLQGQAILIPNAPTDELFRLYGPNDKFLGVGEVDDDGKVAPRRLISTE